MGGRGNASDRASGKFGTTTASGDIFTGWNKPTIEGYGAAEQAAARKIFGKNMTGGELATMAGADVFNGATVEIGLRAGKLEVNIYHAKITDDSGNGGGMMRTFYRDKGGAKISNDAFFLKESAQGQGLGAKSLHSQARVAQAAGVKEINTWALTNPAIPSRGIAESRGHRVWADLGYNGKLSKSVVDQWRAANPLEAIRGIKPPKTIHELYARGGRSFWHRRGESQKMVFSLARGSKSMKILNEYVKKKGY